MNSMMMKTLCFLVFVSLSIAGTGPYAEAAETPASPLDILAEADQLIENERLQDALNLLKGVEVKDPAIANKVDIRFGRIYLRLNKPAKADGHSAYDCPL